MKRLALFGAVVAAGVVAVLAIRAERVQADAMAPLTVVELFTSQSCYSCPPAERFLGELAARDDVVALEFHVDYWDKLVYGSHGRWRDVHSSPQSTQRQRTYNLNIRGEGHVYTPQMVIDGRAEAVGSHRGPVNAAIRKSATEARDRVAITITERQTGGYDIALAGTTQIPASVFFVSFLPEVTTEVRRGENHGKTLVNHNIVQEIRMVGLWKSQDLVIELHGAKLPEGQQCAVLVQADVMGPILGAARCPDGTQS